jgi:hypothetical protein
MSRVAAGSAKTGSAPSSSQEGEGGKGGNRIKKVALLGVDDDVEDRMDMVNDLDKISTSPNTQVIWRHEGSVRSLLCTSDDAGRGK